MSAEMAVRAALIAALRGDLALMDQINGLYDGEPQRAAAPHGFVGECLGADWGGKDVEGREVRLTIGLVVADETPARLAGMIGRIDPAFGSAGVADGWRIVTARLLRSRVARSGAQGWRAVVDYRVRAVREG